jgi:two-component system cell cycle response regulator DivK
MPHVLIIDDSQSNLILTATILSRAGHTAFQAGKAMDGIEIAREKHPDLILMDLGLPDIDGITATHILKTDPQTRTIPIIALTGFGSDKDKAHALAAGCDGFLAKPFDSKELLAQVQSMTRHRKAQ